MTFRIFSIKKQPKANPKGFTLLEVLIVLFILGLLATMAWSGMGLLDDGHRKKITLERMEIIRTAIMGPQGIYDAGGRRVIGGYVGDMKKFPDLWEARAEIRPDFSGSGWPNPDPGLGQSPSWILDPARVFFRPSGAFVAGQWQWHRPYRKLFDDAVNNMDHTGGLETENEGQPRGLWTRFVEDLPFDLPGHPAPGDIEGSEWKGPYLRPPVDQTIADAGHYAASDAEYEELEPRWRSSLSRETWEEGDYAPLGALGEGYDEKEKFRLLNTDGCLADGWGRALRFFITADKDRPGSTIFWIISEGPDFDGRYPAKGTCNVTVWTPDPSDTMGRNYDETLPENQDNIIMKIYSHEFETVFQDQQAQREKETRDLLSLVKKALSGDSPLGRNHGYTGSLGVFPDLYQWETDYWDNEAGAGVPYTKGQPRGLWTRTPNTMDSSDDIAPQAWGVGWRTACIKAPGGTGPDEIFKDAWGRELLFFHDAAANALMVLSPGADGIYDFGDPANPAEAVDISTYTPLAPENMDNIYFVVHAHEFFPGYLNIENITVFNATAGITKARLFQDQGAAASQVRISAALTDEDADGTADDWSTGSAGVPAYLYHDASAESIITGPRSLVIWNDTNGDNAPDSGEPAHILILNITAEPGSNTIPDIRVNSAVFIPIP
ncbi:MAG: prepilin-type N-terminal cleavage/methylation domain-containing protein [Proteobacteria bacterium]|nr:prepilin-type N-terminal cleavage/methylation domain-containing protein [Pseudomonadota bacterium]MBU1387983.1 prepilin-type N-terminal cleavage/methylation domain-containing protein [Pseudomonadota bacterium]MBU1542046.1 prepilin-type N-terminal cleavage/methylation domain-containing protein [Pseudomonadota bacterium]